MEHGYTKADSANLPKVDAFMVANFFASNANFCSSEFRNAKTTISSRPSYGDDAIGYVQLKRDTNLCKIIGKICPEHKVRHQPYVVSMVIDEKEGIVKSVQCNDCPASRGCCKHAVAFLMWSHRRSEEPPCTAIECYWKKSKLSKVGSTTKFITILEMVNGNSNYQKDERVIHDFLVDNRKRKLTNCQMLQHVPDCEDDMVQKMSFHYLSHRFNLDKDCDKFLNQIGSVFSENNIRHMEKLTCEQYKSSAWYELRYARVTASKAFEVTRCKTSGGSLISALMGGKLPDTFPMKRGRTLEDSVKDQLKEQLGEISQCGLFICREHCMLAASPDGILNGDTVIEIKCPMNEKTFKNYIANNKITAKYYAQVQLQMHITKLKKCLFCVASWEFEKNTEVYIVPINYNSDYVKDLICQLVAFWRNNIYPLLYNSTK